MYFEDNNLMPVTTYDNRNFLNNENIQWNDDQNNLIMNSDYYHNILEDNYSAMDLSTKESKNNIDILEGNNSNCQCNMESVKSEIDKLNAKNLIKLENKIKQIDSPLELINKIKNETITLYGIDKDIDKNNLLCNSNDYPSSSSLESLSSSQSSSSSSQSSIINMQGRNDLQRSNNFTLNNCDEGGYNVIFKNNLCFFVIH